MTSEEYRSIKIEELLGRLLNKHEEYIKGKKVKKDITIYCSGDMEIPIPSPRVAVIGSRNPSGRGIAEAKKITTKLVENGVVIVSGLARGIDTVAHKTAIEKGGRTIAVLGTPLNRASPKENTELQDEIMQEHLAISEYPVEQNPGRWSFARRNKIMALISNATVIIEVGESKGTLLHGEASIEMKRPLYLSKIAKDKKSEWSKKMLYDGASILNDPLDILRELPSNIQITKKTLDEWK